MPTSDISSSLISHVKTCWDMSLQYVATGRGVQHRNNAFTPFAYPAYVSAVASVEAFLNESLLSESNRLVLRGSPVRNLETDSLDKLNLQTKLILVPLLFFGETFDKGKQPYQDFALLVKVRNDIVHFKMHLKAPKYVDELSSRGIALTASRVKEKADYAWPHKLSSTEGIRWANNSACKLVTSLVEFIPVQHRGLLAATVGNFREIPDVLNQFNLPRQSESLTNTEGDSDH